MARTNRSTRGSTRGTLTNPTGLDAKASKMLGRVAAQEKVVVQPTINRLDWDQLGRFLISALAAELSPELEITVPDFPLTAGEVISNMDNLFEAPDPVWRNRRMQYKVPHPGVVFESVVAAKNQALADLDRITGPWANDLGDAYATTRAKVRAGQILVNYLQSLYLLERSQNQKTTELIFNLINVYVAEDLVTELCLAEAEKQGVVLRDIVVRPSAQFGYEELMENLGGDIKIKAFGGKMEYTYHLPDPISVAGAMRDLALATQGEGSLNSVKKWFHKMSADEQRLFVYVVDDVLRELIELAAAEKVETENVGGNGHVADPAVAVEAETAVTA